MKNYVVVQPEVIVGIGKETVFEELNPPFKTVKELHINIEDWLGDDLMECHPIFIATQKLKDGLEKEQFTGFSFAEIKLTKDTYFKDNYQLDVELPTMYWLKVSGLPGQDDFALNDNRQLMIDQKLFDFIQKEYNCNYMDVNPDRDELDDLLDSMLAEE